MSTIRVSHRTQRRPDVAAIYISVTQKNCHEARCQPRRNPFYMYYVTSEHNLGRFHEAAAQWAAVLARSSACNASHIAHTPVIFIPNAA